MTQFVTFVGIIVTSMGLTVTFMGKDVTFMGQHVTDLGYLKSERKTELKKHAATIHCSNTLSLLQRKISNALLYHAYHELMSKEEHIITVKQLCRLIGYQGNNHAAIKEALKGLISTIIEWNLIDDVTGTENWTASSIIASVSLQGPVCYFAYSPRMKQLLHSPSMFGKIDLVIQSRFRSSYGLALYENCIRYRGLPYTKWFDMALFKKLMGVPEGKYDIFRDFKRRVLDKAIDEVNTYSDLIISSEFVRERRKVTKIRFSLKERAKKTRLGNSKSKREKGEGSVVQLTTSLMCSDLHRVLMKDFKLTEAQVKRLFAEYSSQFIADKITVVQQSKQFQQGRIENLTAFFFSAVKNNYQLPKSQQEQLAANQHAGITAELKQLQHQVEEMRFAYYGYRENVIDMAISSLPAQQLKDFMQQFYHFAELTINTVLRLQHSKYSRDTVIESPQIKALLRQFALRELDFLPLVSIEEFVAQQPEEKKSAWQKLKSYDPDHPLLRFSE